MKSFKKIYTDIKSKQQTLNKYFAFYVIFLKAWVFHCNLGFLKSWSVFMSKISLAALATSAVPVVPASWDVVCRWAHHPVLSTTSGFSNTITRQRRLTITGVADTVVIPMKTAFMRSKLLFYIYIYIWSMYLVLFSIV